jgi:hypothetical protein
MFASDDLCIESVNIGIAIQTILHLAAPSRALKQRPQSRDAHDRRPEGRKPEMPAREACPPRGAHGRWSPIVCLRGLLERACREAAHALLGRCAGERG